MLKKFLFIAVLFSLVFVIGNRGFLTAKTDNVCPAGDVKANWDGSAWVLEYGSHTIGGNDHTVTWAPFNGQVCLKRGTILDTGIDGMNGTATTGDPAWSHIVLYYSNPSVTPTATPTPSPTVLPTVAPTATPTVSPTALPTVTPTATPRPTCTFFPCPGCPECGCCPTPTATPSITPTATPTVLPTVTPTATPFEEEKTPTPTSTPVETEAPRGGFSDPSTPQCTDTKPNTPYLESATSLTDSVMLKWQKVLGPVTDYSIEYGNESGKNIYSVLSTGNVDTFEVGGLTKGCFAVRAWNGCAAGELSNEVCTSGITSARVLGASTLGATGVAAENLSYLLFSVGSILGALGVRKSSVK